MAKKPEYIGWNREDRDLLVELKTEMGALRDDVKELKDGMKSDIEFLKTDKISRSEAVRINVDQQTINIDHEGRLRWHDKIIYGGLGIVAAAELVLNYFHPFK